MFGVEILLLTILIITVTIYKKNWVPVSPPFYSTGKLVKIGHRGAPSLAHENTLGSFRKAIDTGMDGIELDVQFSADKKLVVYHDWSVKCDSGKIELIENLSWSEIQKIPLNGNEQNKIPLFTDVLDVLNKKIIINIEIKSVHIINTNIEKNVLELIKTYGFENNCVISSFNPFIIRRIKKIDPKILTAFLWSKNDPQFIINTPLWVWICQPDGFHADIVYLDKQLINWVRRKNMSVLTFTVMTQRQLIKAQLLGVDGVFINDPYLN